MRARDALHVRIVREHQRQLLLEHQHARGDRRDDVVARVDQPQRARGMLRSLSCATASRSPSSSLRHAAAALLRGQRRPRCRCARTPRPGPRQIRLVAVAVAGGEQRHPARVVVGRRPAARDGRRGARASALARGCASGTSAAARRGCTPSVFSSSLRARARVRVDRVDDLRRRPECRRCARPRRSSVSSRSRKRCALRRGTCTALARSIRCGKSTFHGCGGTYGHFVM